MTQAKSAWFITLTYDETPKCKECGVDNLSKEDLRNFLKRLRKENDLSHKVVYGKARKSGKTELWPSVRYYAVGEYGTKGARPHYHLIVFNLMIMTADKLDKIWKSGFVHRGSVTGGSIAYTLKYMINSEDESEEICKSHQYEFATMSRNPGIGGKYVSLNKYRLKARKQDFVIDEGYKKELPRYFKEKVFNTHEKEYLKAQKQEYVEKTKISIHDVQGLKDEEERKIHAYNKIATNKNKNRKL